MRINNSLWHTNKISIWNKKVFCLYMIVILIVQFSCSVMSDSLWPHGLQHTRSSVHHQLPELAQTHVHWVSDAIQAPRPLSSPSPLSFNLSQHQGLFQGAFRWSSGIRWPKYWSPSNEYLGLIFFSIYLDRGLTHLKRPWCWERLKEWGEGDDGGGDGWMA